MKHLSLLLLGIGLLTSCVRPLNTFYSTQKIPLYEGPFKRKPVAYIDSSAQFQLHGKGSTRTEGIIRAYVDNNRYFIKDAWAYNFYNEKQWDNLFDYSNRDKAIPVTKLASRSAIKGGGFQVAYATDRVWSFGAHYQTGPHVFYLDYINQNNDKLGPTKGKQLSNYGQSGAGSGVYYNGVTLAYGAVIFGKVGLALEGTLASLKTYQNYSDKRFKEDGYNMIIHKEGTYGWGGTVRYNLTPATVIYGGYNTLTQVKFGMMFTFYKKR